MLLTNLKLMATKIFYGNQYVEKFTCDGKKLNWKQKLVLATKRLVWRSTGLAMLLCALGWAYMAGWHGNSANAQNKPIEIIEVPVKAAFPPFLQRICNAEVTGNPNKTSHQFNKDGSVVRGVLTPSDIGYCQINESINNDLARKLGYDIFTEQGNKDFAVYLFNTRGTQPWNASKEKWSK